MPVVTNAQDVPAYQLSVDDILERAGSDGRRGLTSSEARARLARDGPNELAPAAPVPEWKKFLAQFQDILVLLLLGATAISAGLWLYERDSTLPYEAIAILSVVFLNAIMGYVQESRAESAVAAMQQMSAAYTNVVRDGEQHRIRTAQVVISS
jgi:P-type Ca2+ transporter type 2C